MDIVSFKGNALAESRNWGNLSDEDLHQRAAKAARDRDFAELWALTKAHRFIESPNLSEHTLENYERGLRDLLHYFEGESLLRPKRNAGAYYVRYLETEKSYKPKTVGVKLAAARAFYEALRWSGATEANPFENVRPAPDLVPAWEKRKPFSVGEVETLLKVASEAEQVMIFLGAHSGLRISEMCNLQWSHIKGNRATIRGKGGKVRSVSFSKRLAHALKTWKETSDKRKRKLRPDGAVLPWGVDQARIRLERLCQQCGVDYNNKAMHGLRHSAGTRIYKQTGDLGKAANHLGHAKLDTTRIYAKMAQEEIESEISDW
jgi:integrase/recombinase XerC